MRIRRIVAVGVTLVIITALAWVAGSKAGVRWFAELMLEQHLNAPPDVEGRLALGECQRELLWMIEVRESDSRNAELRAVYDAELVMWSLDPSIDRREDGWHQITADLDLLDGGGLMPRSGAARMYGPRQRSGRAVLHRAFRRDPSERRSAGGLGRVRHVRGP